MPNRLRWGSAAVALVVLVGCGADDARPLLATGRKVHTAPRPAPLQLAGPPLVAPAPTTTTLPPRPTPTRPSRGSPRGAPTAQHGAPRAHPEGLLRRIGGCESSGSPGGTLLFALDHPGKSSASGAYGILDGTWRSWARAYGTGTTAANYARAMHAPPDDQTTVAGRALAAQGTGPWAESAGCWR